MNIVDFYKAKGWHVTSPYGERTDPITKKPKAFHYGVDLGKKPAGEPIQTPVAGTVRTARFFSDAGNAVAIKSAATGLILLFFHLQTLRVKPGQTVKAGDVIGTNGQTGNTTGPHLHLEIRHDKGEHFGSPRPAWGDPVKYTEEAKSTQSSPAGGTYIVKPGDSMWAIAQRHKVPLKDLIVANPHIKNPELIKPGDVLTIPQKR